MIFKDKRHDVEVNTEYPEQCVKYVFTDSGYLSALHDEGFKLPGELIKNWYGGRDGYFSAENSEKLRLDLEAWIYEEAAKWSHIEIIEGAF